MKVHISWFRNYGSWSDEDLKKWLVGQGGTPKTVLEDDEFFKIHSKALRADLNIVEVSENLGTIPSNIDFHSAFK